MILPTGLFRRIISIEQPVSDVDLVNIEPFEAVFPELLTSFLTDINFTESGEDVYQLFVAISRKLGFKSVAYDFCHDVDDVMAELG